MRNLSKTELEKLVALQSNKYRKDVSLILDAYYVVLREAILTGYEVALPNIGKFANKEMDAKPERAGIHPQTLEKIVLPAQPPFNKPTFRFNPSLKSQMKEETLGSVF